MGGVCGGKSGFGGVMGMVIPAGGSDAADAGRVSVTDDDAAAAMAAAAAAAAAAEPGLGGGR